MSMHLLIDGLSLLEDLPWTVPERDRLTRQYERLKKAYGLAVNHLFATGYQATDAEYQKLRVAADDARIDMEVARLELAKSEHNHGVTGLN